MSKKKKKIDARTLKGFQDLLPGDLIPRLEVIRSIEDVFQKYGFVPLDTPALEQYDRAALDAGIGKLPISRAGTAREMALAVVYLVSPAGAYTTGSTLDVDGGEHMGGTW